MDAHWPPPAHSIVKKLVTFVSVFDTQHVNAMLPLVEHMAKEGKFRIQLAIPNDVKHLVHGTGAEFVDAGSVAGGSKHFAVTTIKQFHLIS